MKGRHLHVKGVQFNIIYLSQMQDFTIFAFIRKSETKNRKR